MNRNYYAAYNHYGTRCLFNECNVPVLHVFASKAERDAWVDGDWGKRQEISAYTFRRWQKVCEPKGWVICHENDSFDLMGYVEKVEQGDPKAIEDTLGGLCMAGIPLAMMFLW